MKHTPGPWTTFYENRDEKHPNGWMDTRVDSLSANAVLCPNICIMFCREKTEQNANARLIASAPDLLEALKDLNAWVGVRLGYEYDEDPIAELVHKVIAKAEGI